MNLYILRHGIAADLGSGIFTRDSERPLTAEGRGKVARIAEAMQKMEVEPDLILSSPFVRARQTAEVVARVLRLGNRLAFSDALAVGGESRKLLQEISRLAPAPRNLLLVGHEPSLSSLISLLLSGSPSLTITLKKGGLCKLAAESLKHGRCASLEWLLTPKQLIAMT